MHPYIGPGKRANYLRGKNFHPFKVEFPSLRCKNDLFLGRISSTVKITFNSSNGLHLHVTPWFKVAFPWRSGTILSTKARSQARMNDRLNYNFYSIHLQWNIWENTAWLDSALADSYILKRQNQICFALCWWWSKRVKFDYKTM